ncbi:MAG: protoheme IX farnesyltransferase [Deltaproteobacteria bacterium]|nr:protoheme IX farnesyltransferase [Deltaproteobacteria bacterium]
MTELTLKTTRWASDDAASVIRRIGRTMAAYFELTRARIILLVGFTGAPVLALGRPELPSAAKLALVFAGIFFVGAACGVLNAWVERESDKFMERTKNRPIPSGRVSPRGALLCGLVLTAVAVGLLWVGGSATAGIIGAAVIAFYIAIYTAWLKPRTVQNIVIGGAAGASAPLIVDAAIHGQPGLVGYILFAIIFLWTPPHFWAIALYRRDEYAAAGLPMMPAAVGEDGTRWRQLAYALLMWPVTLLPWATHISGTIYAVGATALGAYFVHAVVRAIRARNDRDDRRVFLASIRYLYALFALMILDAVLRG